MLCHSFLIHFIFESCFMHFLLCFQVCPVIVGSCSSCACLFSTLEKFSHFTLFFPTNLTYYYYINLFPGDVVLQHFVLADKLTKKTIWQTKELTSYLFSAVNCHSIHLSIHSPDELGYCLLRTFVWYNCGFIQSLLVFGLENMILQTDNSLKL